MSRAIIGTSVAVLIFGGMSAEAQTPKSPELKVLDRFVGSWRVEGVSKQANRDEEKLTATSVTKWILQGRYIESRIPIRVGKQSALSLMTYDSDAGVYKTWFFESNSPKPTLFTHRWNESKTTFTGKGNVGNGITVQQTTRFIGNDRNEFTVTVKDASENVVFEMKGKSIRKSDRLPIESAKAQTPKSPELKVLDPFVGSWRVEAVSKQANGDEKKSTGGGVTKWILQGRYIEMRGTKSLNLWTYDDSDAGVYKLWTFFPISPKPIPSTLRWNESKKTFTGKEDVGNGITVQSTIRFIDNDRSESTTTFKDASGKVLGESKGKAFRKK